MIESQPYWAELQRFTESRLIRVIEDGMRDNLGSVSIGKLIMEQMSGGFTRKRGRKIARTETGGALNAGHVVTQQTLETEGVAIRKQWLTVGDADVRDSHAALDGAEVAPSEDFNVGGSLAPHPSHYSLPAAERISCRCAVISAF